MIIEVLYFADFKDVTGKESEEFDLDNKKDVNDLVKVLIAKYPEIEKLIWNEETQKLKNKISLVVNHEIIQSDPSSSIPLSDGDTIAFLLPISASIISKNVSRIGY